MNLTKDNTISDNFSDCYNEDKSDNDKYNVGFNKLIQTSDMNTLQKFSPSSSHREFISTEPGKRFSSLHIFLFGQFIALLLGSNSGAASTIGSFYELNIPVFQSALAYIILAFHLIWMPSSENDTCKENIDENKVLSSTKKSLSIIEDEEKKDEINESDDKTTAEPDVYRLPFIFKRKCIHKPWWIYAFVAFLDVQANFIFVMSFQYTFITSASLLSSMSVPASMISSRFLLKRNFSSTHFLGVAVCFMGVCLMIWSDLNSPNSNLQSLSSPSTDDNNREINTVDSRNGDHLTDYYQYRYPLAWLGDSFAVLGAFLYGLNDTIAEYCVSNIDRVEYLAMLGLFGSIISILQSLIIEREGLYNLIVCEDRLAVFPILAWYAISLAFFYIGVSFFLSISEATLLTLSLQTEDMWTTLFSVFIQRRKLPPFLFYVAATLEISGVCLYEIGLTKPLRNLFSSYIDPEKTVEETKYSNNCDETPKSNNNISKPGEPQINSFYASYGSF